MAPLMGVAASLAGAVMQSQAISAQAEAQAAVAEYQAKIHDYRSKMELANASARAEAIRDNVRQAESAFQNRFAGQSGFMREPEPLGLGLALAGYEGPAGALTEGFWGKELETAAGRMKDYEAASTRSAKKTLALLPFFEAGASIFKFNRGASFGSGPFNWG